MTTIKIYALDASALSIQDTSKIHASAQGNSDLRKLACCSINYTESCPEVSYPAKDLAHLLRTVDDLPFDAINLRRSQAGKHCISPQAWASCNFHYHRNGERC